MLKKHVFLITLFYSAALTFVCLMPVHELPKVGVSFGDKLFHGFTYVILTFLWIHTFVNHFGVPKKRALVYSGVLSIGFGIIIEVLQGVLTTTRQADSLDVLANTCGVLVTICVFLLKYRNTVKKL